MLWYRLDIEAEDIGCSNLIQHDAKVQSMQCALGSKTDVNAYTELKIRPAIPRRP